MRLNQVTLPASDLAKSVEFYQALGLSLIVNALPRYARFEVPGNSASLSVHQADAASANGAIVYFECDDLDQRVSNLKQAGFVFDSGPRDERWLWREARLRDPDDNQLCLYQAGENRLYPPWRITT